MKKIIFVLIFIIQILSQGEIAKAQTSDYYAKVESSGTFFYSAPNENASLFEIPSSYFVKTSEIVGDFYRASYKDIDGYVKKSSARLMDGTPNTPYANATFKMFVENYLYTNPTKNSSVVVSVETNDILTYYGTKSGEQVNSTSNLWYYCSLIKNGQTYRGYAFSGVTDYLSTIPTNYESFKEVSENVPQDNQVTKLSKKTKIMLIISISVPSAMILYFLIKPAKIQALSNKKNTKKQQPKRRNGDYFEFDENDL